MANPSYTAFLTSQYAFKLASPPITPSILTPLPPSSFKTLTTPSQINTPSPRTAEYPSFCNRCFNSSRRTSPTCSGRAGGIDLVFVDNKDNVDKGLERACESDWGMPSVSDCVSWVTQPMTWAICWF